MVHQPALNHTTQCSKTTCATTQTFELPAACTWIEINKTAFEHNIRLYKNIVGSTVHLAVVVKGNAYGHGIKEIGTLCQELSEITWLCTSSVSEALLLRSYGITKPIIVLGIVDGDLRKALEYDIEFLVFSLATVAHINTYALALGKKAKIHIKIDTGLGRFGVFAHQAFNFITTISAFAGIIINGICTHFSESDNQNTQYTHQQLSTFTKLIKELEDRGIFISYRHSSNTAAITSFPESRFNIARIGAGAYGLAPSHTTIESAHSAYKDFSLTPIMTWKTTIIEIRSIPAGSYIGYGRTHTTNKPTTIAIIPIGYYEGYDRRLSNKGMVLVLIQKNGHVVQHYAPVIGRICMNVTLIDITAIDSARIGDHVIVLGDYPNLRAHEIAHSIGSFNPREITTRLNLNLPRIVTS